MSKLTHSYQDNVGFIRVDGGDIVDGQIDIHTAKTLLQGTQEALDYFLRREDSDLAKEKELNYPISTRDGCWEILVPFADTLVTLGIAGVGALGSAVGTGVHSYAKTTGDLVAKRHFADKDRKEVFEAAFRKLEAVIRIAQHLGTVDHKKPLNVTLEGGLSKKALLTNDQGNVMSVSTDELDTFKACPEKLLRSLGSVVTDYRTVSIGYKPVASEIREAVIDIDTKEIFAPASEPHEVVLPELLHGQHVNLRGTVVRGNKITNTIGFQYGGHVITCEPNARPITGYLSAHYQICDLTGVVMRTPASDVMDGKRDRPKIIFDNLIVIAEGTKQPTLLHE